MHMYVRKLEKKGAWKFPKFGEKHKPVYFKNTRATTRHMDENTQSNPRLACYFQSNTTQGLHASPEGTSSNHRSLDTRPHCSN